LSIHPIGIMCCGSHVTALTVLHGKQDRLQQPEGLLLHQVVVEASGNGNTSVVVVTSPPNLHLHHSSLSGADLPAHQFGRHLCDCIAMCHCIALLCILVLQGGSCTTMKKRVHPAPPSQGIAQYFASPKQQMSEGTPSDQIDVDELMEGDQKRARVAQNYDYEFKVKVFPLFIVLLNLPCSRL